MLTSPKKRGCLPPANSEEPAANRNQNQEPGFGKLSHRSERKTIPAANRTRESTTPRQPRDSGWLNSFGDDERNSTSSRSTASFASARPSPVASRYNFMASILWLPRIAAFMGTSCSSGIGLFIYLVRGAVHCWAGLEPDFGGWGRESRVVLPLSLRKELDDDGEAAKTASEDDADCCPKECGKSNRLNILPGNGMTEEIRREVAGCEAEGAAHEHAGEGAAGDDEEDVFPVHLARMGQLEAKSRVCRGGQD